MNKNTELQTSSYTLIHVHVPGRHCKAVFGRSRAVGPGDSAAAPSGGNLQTLPLCSSLHLQWNIQIINLHRYVLYVNIWFLTVPHTVTQDSVLCICSWLTGVSGQHLFLELSQDPVCDLNSGLELCHIGQGGRQRVQDRLLIGRCHQAPTNS